MPGTNIVGTAPGMEFSPSSLLKRGHLSEWLSSGVDPELISSNVVSLADRGAYDYLFYSSDLPRNASGRLTSQTLKTYGHLDTGGWWCQSLDPDNGWEPMLWGCFKPDQTRSGWKNKKIIKYEHPPSVPTRAFFLDVPQRIAEKIAQGLPKVPKRAEDEAFWAWVLNHPEVPIVLTEGAKKAGCLLSLGVVAIALPGVFNGRRVERDDWGQMISENLIPELALFAQAGREVSFCFDHDTKPETVHNVTQAIWSTGRLLTKADCKVSVIALPGPEKGVDDFIQAQGIAAFQGVMRAALSLPLWHWQEMQRLSLNVKPALEFNDSDLTKLISADVPRDGLWVLGSAKGTGKTKLIADLVRSSNKVLAIGHRISLMRNICDRMGLDYKGDLDRVQGQFINAEGYSHRIGLCIDSLLSVDPQQFQGGVLIVDEFMQVFAHVLLSETCNKDGKRAAILDRLTALVRTASWVILADADAADVGIKYFQELAQNNKEVRLLLNHHIPEGFHAKLIHAKQENPALTELIADVQAGKRVFVATDSIGRAKAIAELLKPLQAQGLLIHSGTSGEKAQRAFITDPNQQAAQYPWVIATPSLSTGVSLEVEHFDKVYGFFYGVITDAEAMQALSRVRAKVPRVIWCKERSRDSHSLSSSFIPEQVEQSLRTQFSAEASLLRTSMNCLSGLSEEMDKYLWEHNHHVKLFTQLVARRNDSLWHLRDYLEARLLYEGNTVEVVEVDVEVGDNAMKTARKTVNEAHFISVANAPDLSAGDLSALSIQETRSQLNQWAIEKAMVKDFLGLEALSAKDVEFHQRYRSQVMQLEMLLFGAELSIHRDLSARQRQEQWGAGFLPFDQPNHELSRFARDQLGLQPFLEAGIAWTSDDLQALGDRARLCRSQIKEFLGFTIPDDPQHCKNGWIFQHLMRQLGLKVNTFRVGKRGQQVKHYMIDVEHYDKMMTVLEQRWKAKAGFSPGFEVELDDHVGALLYSDQPTEADYALIDRPPDPSSEVEDPPSGSDWQKLSVRVYRRFARLVKTDPLGP